MIRSLKSLIKPLSTKPIIKEVFLGFNGGIVKADRHFKKKCQVLPELKNIDVIIAHDCFCLPSAANLSKRKNADVIYDAVDYPFMNGRTGSAYRLLPSSGKYLIHKCHAQAIRDVKHILTISNPMAEVLSSAFSKPVHAVQNAHKPQYDGSNKSTNPTIKSLSTLVKGSRVICSFGTLFEGDGLTETIRSFQYLPVQTYFIVFGKFQTPSYEDIVLNTLLELPDEVRKRIILLPFLNKTEMAEVFSLCDIGVMLWHQDHENLKHGLPNRFWDAASLGLPMVHSNMTSINQLASQYKLQGAYGVCDNFEPKNIANRINAILQNLTFNRDDIINMAESEYNKDRETFKALINTVNQKPRHIAILSRTSLIHNQRVSRQTAWLNEMDTNVTIVSMESINNGTDRKLKIRKFYVQ
jgi:hypothetical protein